MTRSAASPQSESSNPSETDSASAAPGARIHFWFGVITLIYALDFADRFAVSGILPHLKQEFALSDAQSGLLGGIIYLGLAVFALPSGALVDRWSRKGMIAIMTISWSLATWAAGLAKSFKFLLATRLLVGVGEAGYNLQGIH